MCTSRRLACFAAALLLAAVPQYAVAQPVASVSTAHLVEWDLPFQADANPGAVVVDTRAEDYNRLWFVTRVGFTGEPRVYRFDPPQSLTRGSARFTSWSLVEPAFSGGVRKLRPSRDRRYLFVRTSSFVERMDTQKCLPGTPAMPKTCDGALTLWQFPIDGAPATNPFVSDIAVDDLNRVFTTGFTNVFPGYVQMLTPVATPAAGTLVDTFVTRWIVGGGLTLCTPSGPSAPCASGIDINPANRNLVYFSDPGGNSIGELNISTNVVRRWPLTAFDTVDALGKTQPVVTEPRQLKIDRYGKVWVVTGSGHLVSLSPATNKMTKHEMPASLLNDPFGVAPDDDVIGYTGAASNKVGMLFPKGAAIVVAPLCTTAVRDDAVPAVVISGPSVVVTDTTPGDPKIVQAQTTRKADGTFVEALVTTNGNNSFSPLGITPNKGKAQGTFFYTVGLSQALDPAKQPSFANRVGFVRMPIKERIQRPRDDDDADDGYDRNTHPGWHNSEPGDDDADGISDRFDMPTSREDTTTADAAPVAAGQSVGYPMTASAGTLALIASIEADPTAQIAVDIYNALGTLSATSGPLVGAAVATIAAPASGNYTVRVRNIGVGSITHTPTFIVRQTPVP
jgi:streptogramin lyase